VISLGVGLKEINTKLKTRYVVLMFGVSCCWQDNIPIAGVIIAKRCKKGTKGATLFQEILPLPVLSRKSRCLIS
jgi:hypothetical protein